MTTKNQLAIHLFLRQASMINTLKNIIDIIFQQPQWAMSDSGSMDEDNTHEDQVNIHEDAEQNHSPKREEVTPW